MKCTRTDCNNEATSHVVLKAYSDKGNTATEVWTGVYVCPEHEDGVTVASVVNNESWSRVEETFRLQGKPAPDMERTDIKFEPVEPS